MFKLTLLTALVVSSGSNLLQARDTDAAAVIIPLHDGSRPVTIHANTMQGGINIHGEDRKDVAVESRARAHRDEDSSEPVDGMKRIDLGGQSGLDIREDNNVVTIKTDSFNHGGDLNISVPRRASLQLKCLNGGDIRVEGVEGEIEVENLNGGISLKDVSGSVVAHSLNGAVTADMKAVDPGKPMSFSTMNGVIDVTLPATVKANVSMKTDNGEILSDFEVKLDNKPASVSKGREADGSYHVRVDKTMHGAINGGGPEYQFRSFNGQILIRKRK